MVAATGTGSGASGFAVGAEDVARLVFREFRVGGDLRGDAFFDGWGEVGGVAADGGDLVLDIGGQLSGELRALLADGVAEEFLLLRLEQAAVFHLLDPRNEFHHGAVVRGRDDGDALFDHEVVEQSEDRDGGGGVELAGWLIGEDQGGRVCQGPGDGDSLLLAAREFVGAVAGASGEADGFEQFFGAAAAFTDAGSGDAEGEFDVFVGGEQRQQSEGLEDEADSVAAELGELALVVLGDVLVIDCDVARGG